jgi:hypothetical protein
LEAAALENVSTMLLQNTALGVEVRWSSQSRQNFVEELNLAYITVAIVPKAEANFAVQ